MICAKRRWLGGALANTPVGRPAEPPGRHVRSENEPANLKSAKGPRKGGAVGPGPRLADHPVPIDAVDLKAGATARVGRPMLLRALVICQEGPQNVFLRAAQLRGLVGCFGERRSHNRGACVRGGTVGASSLAPPTVAAGVSTCPILAVLGGRIKGASRRREKPPLTTPPTAAAARAMSGECR